MNSFRDFGQVLTFLHYKILPWFGVKLTSLHAFRTQQINLVYSLPAKEHYLILKQATMQS